MRRKLYAVAVLAAIGVLAAVASGQTQDRPATMDDLLAELRGLRADLNHSGCRQRADAVGSSLGCLCRSNASTLWGVN